MVGINDDAFKPISPVLFLNSSPALAWTATEILQASIISLIKNIELEGLNKAEMQTINSYFKTLINQSEFLDLSTGMAEGPITF